VFPKEIWTYPKSWVAKQYNLKRWTVMPAGGVAFASPSELESQQTRHCHESCSECTGLILGRVNCKPSHLLHCHYR
jgi:hypothetical protein